MTEFINTNNNLIIEKKAISESYQIKKENRNQFCNDKHNFENKVRNFSDLTNSTNINTITNTNINKTNKILNFDYQIKLITNYLKTAKIFKEEKRTSRFNSDIDLSPTRKNQVNDQVNDQVMDKLYVMDKLKKCNTENEILTNKKTAKTAKLPSKASIKLEPVENKDFNKIQTLKKTDKNLARNSSDNASESESEINELSFKNKEYSTNTQLLHNIQKHSDITNSGDTVRFSAEYLENIDNAENRKLSLTQSIIDFTDNEYLTYKDLISDDNNYGENKKESIDSNDNFDINKYFAAHPTKEITKVPEENFNSPKVLSVMSFDSSLSFGFDKFDKDDKADKDDKDDKADLAVNKLDDKLDYMPVDKPINLDKLEKPKLETEKKLKHPSFDRLVEEEDDVEKMITSIIKKKNSKSNLSQSNTSKKLIEEDESNNFSNTEELEDIKDFNLYIKECLHKVKKSNLESSKINLENHYIDYRLNKNIYKKLIIFDLDETLIHCLKKDIEKADQTISFQLPCGKQIKVGINIRPFVKECLQKLKEAKYDIICYTASIKHYANAVLDIFDKNNEIFSLRLYRENCVKDVIDENIVYIKDLRIFKNVDIKDMLIVDNSLLSFACHLDSGIPILPFYDNKSDIELVYLANYLESIANKPDLRLENIKYIKYTYDHKSAYSVNYESSLELIIDNENGLSSSSEANISLSNIVSSNSNDSNKELVVELKNSY